MKQAQALLLLPMLLLKTKEPVSQGFVSLMEPFFDTVIVCSMTAFVIIITGEYLNYSKGISGVELTSAAFQSAISFFPVYFSFHNNSFCNFNNYLLVLLWSKSLGIYIWRRFQKNKAVSNFILSMCCNRFINEYSKCN